jgi:hypothetical protein
VLRTKCSSLFELKGADKKIQSSISVLGKKMVWNHDSVDQDGDLVKYISSEYCIAQRSREWLLLHNQLIIRFVVSKA